MWQFQFTSGMWAVLALAILVFLVIIVGMTVFWIWMIVDCVKRKKLSDGERIAWILLLIFLHFLGALIYYIAVKRE